LLSLADDSGKNLPRPLVFPAICRSQLPEPASSKRPPFPHFFVGRVNSFACLCTGFFLGPFFPPFFGGPLFFSFGEPFAYHPCSRVLPFSFAGGFCFWFLPSPCPCGTFRPDIFNLLSCVIPRADGSSLSFYLSFFDVRFRAVPQYGASLTRVPPCSSWRLFSPLSFCRAVSADL